MSPQPWIYNKTADVAFILIPPFLAVSLIFLFPYTFIDAEVDIFWWIILVLLIDVSHVYSTLYRTYFDASMWKTHRKHMLLIPLISWILGVILFSFGAMIFWSFLAYVAVFHFIRQQYGFHRIYSRLEAPSVKEKWLDNLAIYSATIYPIVYWHLSGDRSFHWFVEGDFYLADLGWLIPYLFGCYLLIQAAYLVKELVFSIRRGSFNVPKNLVWFGTTVSWYTGIVAFNGDLTFTLTNVITHGIPYMALVWMVGRKKKNPAIGYDIFSYKNLAVFIGFLALLAFTEEGLWDSLVWRDEDHRYAFGFLHFIPVVKAKDLLSLVVPLLAVPQLTHYILDGFIWKVKKGDV